MTQQHQEDSGIELLRCVAACMVMATHYAQWVTAAPGAWAFLSTGVNLFFVLSGFVFAPYFFGRPLPLVPHAIRRWFRMYPLYLVALLSYVALKESVDAAWTFFPHHLAMGHTLQSQAIAFYYNPAFWSLPVEVEFYALLPLLGFLSRRLSFASVALLALVMHLAVVFVEPVGLFSQEVKTVASVHFPALLVEFIVGVWGYVIACNIRGKHTVAVFFGLGGIASLGACGLLFSTFLVAHSGEALAPPLWVAGNIGFFSASAYMLIVVSVSALMHSPSAAVEWFCSWGGRLSYGIYLFHNASQTLVSRYFPALQDLSGALVSSALTLLIAFFLHLLVESPCRGLGHRLSQKWT